MSSLASTPQSKIKSSPARTLQTTQRPSPSTGSPDFPRAFAKAAADAVRKVPLKPKATSSKTQGKSDGKPAASSRRPDYRNLVDPATQQQRKDQHLEAFEKLKSLSLADLQIEFIVCIRAEHYKDALMYSEMILAKEPGNTLVAQFQPLLANLAIQANDRLVEDSDSSEGDENAEGEDADEEKEGEEGEEGDSESSDSDDPATAWMWSPTWRTDPDPEDQDDSDGDSARAPAGAAGPRGR